MKTKKSKFQLNKVVVVYWKDACSTDSWDTIDSYLKHTTLQCRTAGFLLTSNKDYVTITPTESVHGQLNQAIAIPKAWISKMQVIDDLLVEPLKKKPLKKKLDK